MRLSEFIRTNKVAIIKEWIDFAESLTPAATTMSTLQLKDHIEQILLFVAADIESAQSSTQQLAKSKGKADVVPGSKETASEIHGDIRHADGFDIVQMVSEYRALRASIIKLWGAAKKTLNDVDVLDLTRFNESIDQSLAESVVRFTERVDYSKDLLLGILGHDIRSPLGAITMSAHLLSKMGTLNEKQAILASQIESSGKRIANIVTDLLDLTRARIGSGLPIKREKMVLEQLARQITDEMRIQYPAQLILVKSTGNSEGEWDVVRLGQVLSNLIGNAIQYGAGNAPVTLTLGEEGTDILLQVHNEGTAIPSLQLGTLFDSFTRGASVTKQPTDVSSNLGLGLFITKEIIHSHSGTIHVSSDETEGTNFFIRLPRS